jgi:nicotinate-nucleotide pyrophosphorylase (carboxylating)
MEIPDLVAAALAEDVGSGDATSEALVPEAARARGRIVRKAPGAVFGIDVATEVFRQAGAGELERSVSEGEWRDEVPVDVARIEGPARAILTAERTAMNFLCHLSGIATLAARFVAAVEGTRTTILDTRKTTPGMRELEKAAVAAGGGTNHRMGLSDAYLLKENHLAVAGGIEAAVEAARAARPDLAVEVECKDLREVREGLAAGADRLLLDNMSTELLRAAVALRDGTADAELEASGGITLANVAGVAATGVDYISVGALTHSAPALDLSLLVEPESL